MSELLDRDLPSTSPFSGLRPTRLTTGALTGSARHRSPGEPARANRAMMATMPVILVGSLALSTLGFAPTLEHSKPSHRNRADASNPKLADVKIESSTAPSQPVLSGTIDTAAVTPATYTVRHGDTVSGIAGRYGLSTASVLALNGLGWKSLIFAGQVLRLAKPTTTVAQATTAPAQPAVSTVSSRSYVIQRGDTVTAIAKKLGLSVSAVLSANGLSVSSIIYAWRTLVIPTAGAQAAAPTSTQPSATQVAQVGAVTVPLSPSMAANAKIIISVGRSLGVPDYGIVVALAAAAQESDLQNLNYGDRDSVGLFQQRPSTGWGTIAQLTQPAYAAELFYGGPRNPNKGRTRGLLDIAGWQSMTVTQAAQAVQISGAPTAYAKWETSARAWLAQLG
ncbi:MAG TPA: LysM peptidoglycan-binding domain-containing protein [Galbitalea sp.]